MTIVSLCSATSEVVCRMYVIIIIRMRAMSLIIIIQTYEGSDCKATVTGGLYSRRFNYRQITTT